MCVRASTLSNINISETSRPIVIKFHLEHYWGGGLSVISFRPDRIRTLVSMATDSSHRVIMGKFCKIGPGTEELAAPERLKKSP